MKPTFSLVTALLFGLALPGPALAQGPSATVLQRKQIVRDFHDQLRANRDAAAQAGRDLLAAAQLLLNLPQAQLDTLELDLEAAFEAAKTAFEALPAVDQTEANLKPLIMAELAKVWPNYTVDAAQLATLDMYAQTFTDAVAPLEIALIAIRAAFHQAMAALR
jgi:hypothetical protein